MRIVCVCVGVWVWVNKRRGRTRCRGKGRRRRRRHRCPFLPFAVRAPPPAGKSAHTGGCTAGGVYTTYLLNCLWHTICASSMARTSAAIFVYVLGTTRGSAGVANAQPSPFRAKSLKLQQKSSLVPSLASWCFVGRCRRWELRPALQRDTAPLSFFTVDLAVTV